MQMVKICVKLKQTEFIEEYRENYNRVFDISKQWVGLTGRCGARAV